MVNYLEKIFCVEVLEKISRMQRFLRTDPNTSHRRDNDIITIYIKALNATAENLKPITTRLSETTILGEWERLAIVRRLSDIFRSVDELHLHLEYVYGTWVRPETNVFIRNVLEFIPADRRPEKVNIILSNMYSFLEVDLSEYVEHVLSSTDIKVDFQGHSPSIFLPKIEWKNSLNWAILVHECGHVDSQANNIIRSKESLLPNELDTPSGKILQNWMEEIYCDIFAAKILGPAYLASFATFAIVVAGAGGSEIISETHPPDIVRITIIQEMLEKSKLIVKLRSPEFGCNDLSSLFYTLLEERAKLDRIRTPLTKEKSGERKLPEIPGDYIDEICDQVDEIISLQKQLTIKDFTRVEGLAQRLSKGILIGSYRNPALAQSVNHEILKKGISSGELANVKDAIQESRVLLWEIVNAGWLHKVEIMYPQAFSIFFGDDGSPIDEKIAKWGEELEITDKLLLKSIEASEIQRLIEEG